MLQVGIHPSLRTLVPNPFIPLADSVEGALTQQAFQIRLSGRYARFPIQHCHQQLCREFSSSGEKGVDCFDFQAAEGVYRAGGQGVQLSEIPKLPQSLIQLSRLSIIDKAGRAKLRAWAESCGRIFDESQFLSRWRSQGEIGGAEHQVYYEEDSGRWLKRLYASLNGSTLGDYLDRMILHAALFPETAYRLEGFTVNAKSKAIAPLISQPHVSVAIGESPVSKDETSALMTEIGFDPIQLRFEGLLDDGYFGYYHRKVGILVHDLHDENVVRMSSTGELAIIDPFISVARKGTWAGIKLAEVGVVHLPDPHDPVIANLPQNIPPLSGPPLSP